MTEPKSAEEVVRVLKDAVFVLRGGGYRDRADGLLQIIESITALQARVEQQAADITQARTTAEYWKAEHNAANARIAELEKAGQWVAVSERLPEPGVSVLLIVPTFSDRAVPGYLDGRKHLLGYRDCWRLESAACRWEATHWMPLPPAPQESTL